MQPLGDQLVEMLKGARQECLLAAPYIKRGTLAKLLEAIEPSCHLRVVTRWRVDEIAAGVSDLEVWKLLHDRGNSELWLQPTLHAKYYRSDDKISIGSANLTHAALGWGASPNLEILEEIPPNHSRWAQFERELFNGVTNVTDALVKAFEAALDDFLTLSPAIPPPTDEVVSSLADWRPSLRFPADLFAFYSGDGEQLTSAARQAAATDLFSLQPPNGLTSRAFKAWVGLALLQNGEFQAIDRFVQSSRRFGEMRDLLAGRGCKDASRDWQTWMRWILHFLPDHFSFHTANYSEIVSRPVIKGHRSI